MRRKYHAFRRPAEGQPDRPYPRGPVPGGMLTNLEGQLKQQNAAHRLDEVLAEIPACARPGFIPLVTPDPQDCPVPVRC